jgi:hypothetical protein
MLPEASACPLRVHVHATATLAAATALGSSSQEQAGRHGLAYRASMGKYGRDGQLVRLYQGIRIRGP